MSESTSRIFQDGIAKPCIIKNSSGADSTSRFSGSKLLREWKDMELQWHTYGNYFEKWQERNCMRASFNNIEIGSYARRDESKQFRVYFGNTVFTDYAETADQAEAMITAKFLEWIQTLSVFYSNHELHPRRGHIEDYRPVSSGARSLRGSLLSAVS